MKKVYKEYTREDFIKAFKEHMRKKFPRGTFKYLNVVMTRREMTFSISVKEGKKFPDFMLEEMKLYSWSPGHETTLSFRFDNMKDVFNDFDGLNIERFLYDDANVYAMGIEVGPETEEDKVNKKIEENKCDIIEIIEAGLHLSDNPEEIEYLKMLADRLFI